MTSAFDFIARALFGVALVLGLTAVANAQSRAADPQALERIYSIGIVSALPGTITVRRIGTTKTDKAGSGLSEFANPNWDLNKRIIALVTEQLSHRYIIKPVVYEPQQLAGFRGREAAKTLGPIKSKNLDNPVNAYLVIVPREVSDSETPQDLTLEGLGLYRLYKSTRPPATTLFAGYQITLVETSDYKVVARSRAVLHGSPTGAPQRGADPALWSEAPAVLSAHQKLKLRGELTKLVEDSIPHTLAELELTP